MSGPTSSESKTSGAHSLPVFERTEASPLGLAEWIAAGLSLVWVLFFLLNGALSGTETGVSSWSDPVLSLLALTLPVLLIWVAALSIRSTRLVQAEGDRLHAVIDNLRTTYLTQAQQQAAVAEPSMTKKLEEIIEAARNTETALATFQSSRSEPHREGQPVPLSAPTGDDQGALALGTPAEDSKPPLPVHQFIRALNFPETAEDQDGFVALRLALQDRKASQVIQAAQDVLTLLSQDGIYMDDLRPDMSRPEIWRQFAQGARGKEIAALGGVRDRAALALASARMKQDPIFRDAAHHFLRRFDQMFAEFESSASDSEISALSETRTARAFMLLGRVAGTFD
ncbi:hypothetical protein GFB49_09840 [Epibacterium sp. SM1979]|uniref:Uncharacterized protein n=1 Tax=Tritonibacter litoralis TaxID=2662264 RepID=A0A843YH45_9RHOB|nr:hypothetical protein [Tritonibacter litoralis]MQQ08754.1 hypothetical protein [Tritonibacter litoralis]